MNFTYYKNEKEVNREAFTSQFGERDIDNFEKSLARAFKKDGKPHSVFITMPFWNPAHDQPTFELKIK